VEAEWRATYTTPVGLGWGLGVPGLQFKGEVTQREAESVKEPFRTRR